MTLLVFIKLQVNYFLVPMFLLIFMIDPMNDDLTSRQPSLILFGLFPTCSLSVGSFDSNYLDRLNIFFSTCYS